MSKKLQGNGLWESSRIILPQHRDKILEHHKTYNKKVKPTLHEDEWELIFRDINSSVNEETPIVVTFFGEYQYSEIVGVVTSVSQIQKKFKIEYEYGFEWVDFDEIVSVKIQ